MCDGVDNDCNGQIDDGLNGRPEICNGLDDNCNGVVDEGNPGGGLSCATGEPGVCSAGTMHCTAGALACVRNVGPGPETCNGMDDNCNGVVDEVGRRRRRRRGRLHRTTAPTPTTRRRTATDNPGTPTSSGRRHDGIGDVCDCTPDNPRNPPRERWARRSGPAARRAR